jgi:broad specificity phosphatase PhoE
MKYLILVKHSMPEIIENIPGREWKLSDQGKTLAQGLAERLRSYQPDVIISSIEPKAVETAEIIAQALGLTTQIVADLHEHERSKTTFLPGGVFQLAIQEFFDKPDQLVFGDETANQAHQRFSNTVYSIVGKFINQTIVIIAHGTVISLFVSRLTGTSGFSLWSELGLPSLVVLDMQSNRIIAKENIR